MLKEYTILREGLMKTKINLSHDSRFPGQNSNQTLPKHKATQPARFFLIILYRKLNQCFRFELQGTCAQTISGKSSQSRTRSSYLHSRSAWGACSSAIRRSTVTLRVAGHAGWDFVCEKHSVRLLGYIALRAQETGSPEGDWVSRYSWFYSLLSSKFQDRVPYVKLKTVLVFSQVSTSPWRRTGEWRWPPH